MKKISSLSVILLSTYLTLFFVNLIFIFIYKNSHNEILKKFEQLNYDKRHPYLVLHELNKKQKSVTAQHPIIYLYRSKDFVENFFPLSGYSNVNNLLCNENGQWIYYQSDKYGFNNINQEYEELKDTNKKNILLIGDSYVEGTCAKRENHFKSKIQKNNYNVINLGKGGNGSLIEYATLIEYFEVGNFDIVLWFYYPNDLFDLIKERNDNFLLKYLDDNDFKQNIINKQTIVNQFYEKSSDGYNGYFNFIKNLKEEDIKLKLKNLEKIDYFKQQLGLKEYNIKDYLILTILREEIDKKIKFILRKNEINNSYPVFEKIILKAKNYIENNGSKLIVIYLPSREEILLKEESDKKIIEILENNKIEYIDINKKIVPKYSYNDVFSFGQPNVHYNNETYSLISDLIVNHLNN